MVLWHIDPYGPLAQADRLIAELKLRISRQCAVSLRLAMRGHDTTEAEAQLRLLTDTLVTVQAYRDVFLHRWNDLP